MHPEYGLPSYPDKFFDLAVVDPPYGIGRDGKRKSTSSSGGHKGFEFKGWDANTPNQTYFNELFRVSKNQIIWGANYYPQHLLPSMGWVFWDKGQDIMQSDGELAYTSFNRALRRVKISRLQLFIEGGTIHPTQKPIKLYQWLLENYATEGNLILDTHVGSASSLIACESMGFNYVGFELDSDYYEAAQKRLKTVQKRLF